jgi:hypothetical protein
VGDTQDQASSENDLLWVIIIVIILTFVILFFVVRQTHKYNEVRRAVRKLPKLEYNQAKDILDRKRKQGDKYFLSNLIKNLPEVMETEPDKLFNLLSMLTKDDIPEVRENAAKNLARLIDTHPEKLLVWYRSLQQLGVRTEIYKIIYRSLANPPLKELTETYYTILTATKEQEYKSSLEKMDAILAKHKTIKYGDELSLIYSALNTFSKYRTISSISTSGSIIAGIQIHYKKAPTSLYPEVKEMFGKLGLVAETMVKYEKVEGVEDKISYLSQGINLIEDVSRFAREKLPTPEKELFLLVSTSWRNIIVFSMRELRGRAKLSFRLISKEVTPELATMTLMLELENIGRGVAERTLVEVVPTNDYTILSEPHEIGRIGQKRRKEVSFEIRPRTNEPFRVEFAIRYDDSERKGKSTSFGDLVTFVEAGPDFQEIPNPYIVGTPIKAGSKLFVGRQDLIKFIQKNIKGELQENIIVRIGHRRTGKTTLLKQLPIHMPQNFIPVYIDIQGIIDPGMDAFLYLLASEITTSMNDRGIDIPEPEYEQFEKRPSYFFEHKFLKQVYDKLGDSILVILFDEFEELEIKVDSGILDKNIFSYLRHLMQHTSQLAFIFTGTSRLENLKSDYWSIMFNIALYKRISFLSEPETTELIVEPVKEYNMVYDSLAIEKIYRLTSGHPYFTQLICHALVNLHNSDQKNYITVQDVNGEIQRIIERGQMHFDFIWDQATHIERVVMTALMKALGEDETVTVSSLVNKIGEFGLQFTPKNISKALDLLIQKDIVTKALHRTTTYEFKIDLIRVWLESAKNLDQVVENYRTDS